MRRGAVSKEFLERLETLYPLESRVYAEEELLADWAGHVLTGDEETARENLDLFSLIAGEIADRRKDTMLPEIASRLSAAAAVERAALASDIRIYAEGMRLYRKQAYDDAEPTLLAAYRAFRRKSLPLAEPARFYRGVCLYFRNVRAATAEFRDHKASVDATRYPVIAAQLRWMLGTCYSVQDKLPQAYQEFQGTGPLLALGLGSRQGTVADVLLAGILEKMGETRQAWRHRLTGLHSLGTTIDRKRPHSVLFDGAVWLEARGKLELAALFLQEARQNAIGADLPFAEAEIALLDSEVQMEMGRLQPARDLARQSLEAAARIQNGGLKRRTESWAHLVGAVALAEEDRGRAIESLDRAHSELAENGWLAQELKYRLLLADQLIAAGQTDQARKTLERSVYIYEQRRTDVDRRLAKVMISREARNTFHKLLELQIRQAPEDTWSALATGERAKLTGVFDAGARYLDGASLRRDLQILTPKAAIATFTVLERDVIRWTMDSKGLMTQHRLPMSTDELKSEVLEFERAVQRDDGAQVRTRGARLFEVLFGPFIPELTESGAHLFIIPDSFLARVPYSALFDAKTQRFLIQKVAWSLAPSLSTAASLASSSPHTRIARALVLAAPDLQGTAYGELPKLKGARSEAAIFQELYPDSPVLVGAEAVRSRVLREIGNVDALHFAGHAVRNGVRIEDNCIPLSQDAGDSSSSICVSDLIDLELKNLQLVTLGACASLGGFDPEDSENHFRLAQGFLAVGSRTVLAPLWNIDDRESVRLPAEFHRRLRQGESASEAFRSAIIQEIDLNSRRSSQWASFVMLGN